ncbi:hypothetical protein GWI33_014330 [Rhynchophorus ferrugineus]|uniref:Uncharacterized protein n=1 Tax=Rhynchophorus ferrugineus TaxID=354439 RepID=A0A834MCF8_RHYFE|nr:hypothetical protein GWI33_014330 [Rhynchophorus ferrugineus]
MNRNLDPPVTGPGHKSRPFALFSSFGRRQRKPAHRIVPSSRHLHIVLYSNGRTKCHEQLTLRLGTVSGDKKRSSRLALRRSPDCQDGVSLLWFVEERTGDRDTSFDCPLNQAICLLSAVSR